MAIETFIHQKINYCSFISFPKLKRCTFHWRIGRHIIRIIGKEGDLILIGDFNIDYGITQIN